MPFTLGIDYGANSVRALLVDVSNGRELATCVLDYEVANKVSSAMPTRSGNARAITSSVWRNRCVAPWSKPPRTQLFWPRTSSASAWTPRFEPAPGGGAQRSSGPARAVEGSPGWRNVGYGKINTSSREADRITGMAVKHRPHYMAKVGNTHSSEWFKSKIWHCLEHRARGVRRTGSPPAEHRRQARSCTARFQCARRSCNHCFNC